MIYGIGHDVLEIERISEVMLRGQGKKFNQRILTEQEYQLAEQRGGRLAEFVAGRFAAKEAVVKALGCGIGNVVGFQDIEILPDHKGKPEVTLSCEAWSRLDLPERQKYIIHLTITHGRDLASAFAVVEELGS
ncbi:holo-[acyl-carrier protein] synthase [Paenibacillus sp. PastF-3]|uniref:holo-ACP synthase n=1 Tax=unclassified Paenibacillus TaxID=185978 RepID=UPI000BA109EE|nr:MULTISPECIES: holo-ACP synthase [unclassified Paenibacillus]MDH6373369.1 holo-[acyl-carrier protein] synthase [Paenibacillus sp. PastF-3]OZQ87780.1 holo-[acyl-carrier-protein] synthase [Paenibacillus sp. VTT E-133291]